MQNRDHFGWIFPVMGIILIFLLVRFGQELSEPWKYGVVYSAILMVFIPILSRGRRTDAGASGSDAFPTLIYVFLFSGICIVLFLPAPLEFIRDQDWSHQLAGANQILKGKHPFMTFLDSYGPLTFYSSALMQFLFDTRVIGEIILVTLGYSIAYTILFWLMWSLCQDKTLSYLLVAILIILVPRLYKYYIVLGPALSLLFIWKYLEGPAYKKLWLVGLAVVLTGLFRPDFGAYMVMAAAAAIFLRPVKAVTFMQKLGELLLFCAVLIAVASPWLIFVALGGGLRDYLYYSTIGGAVAGSGMSRPLSISSNLLSMENLQVLTTIAFTLIPGLTLILLLQRRHVVDADILPRLLVLIVAAQLTLIQGWHRTDWEHLLQAIPTAFILLAYLFKRIRSTLWDENRYVASVGLVIGIGLLSSVLMYRLPNLERVSVTRTLNNLRVYSLQRDRFTGFLTGQTPNSPLLQAMNFIRTCTDPDDKIIAWPYLIDFYYFTDRPLGGRLKAVAPIFSGPEEEEMIVRSMESDDIAFFIFQSHIFNPAIPNIQDYAPVIAKHLKETYIPIQEYGQITIHVNRNRKPPADCFVR